MKSDITVDFSDLTPGSECTFECTSYCAVHFHALRQVYLDSERSFVQSVAFVHGWAATGGKSGASFYQTEDKRFVIKSIDHAEFQMFLNSALAYFRHMHEVRAHAQSCVLWLCVVSVLCVCVCVAWGRDTHTVPCTPRRCWKTATPCW